MIGCRVKGEAVRHYQAVVNQEWLLASSSQEVVRFLEKRASQPNDIRFEKDADEKLEVALFERNDPLIMLALARYAAYSKVVSQIFASASGSDARSKALRLSALSNEKMGGHSFTELPNGLFKDRSSLLSYLACADLEEISVLFQNRTIDDAFLRNFLEGKESWECMSEEHRMAAVAALLYNERLVTPYDRTFMDGYAEYNYGAVFDAVWKLSERLPVTREWAARLCWLFDKVLTDAFSMEKPLEVAQRWKPDASDQKAIEKETEENGRGYLSIYQGVRKGLGMLALSKSSPLLADLMASDDPAFRCAAYRAGNLSPEQISAAYDRDGELFFNEAVDNANLWQRLATREALHGAAWAIVHHDRHSDLMAANIFNGVKERMAKEHPDWFKDEGYQPGIAAGDKQVTQDDLNQATNAIVSSTATAFEQFRQAVVAMQKRIGWIWWFSLGVAVGSLWEHF